MSNQTQNEKQDEEIEFQIGRYEVFFRKEYKIIYTVNDFLIGTTFLIGSIFFFFSAYMYWGTWLFVIGSAMLLIRPTIKLVHDFHLKRVVTRQQRDGRSSSVTARK